jgi:hypothetical protein
MDNKKLENKIDRLETRIFELINKVKNLEVRNNISSLHPMWQEQIKKQIKSTFPAMTMDDITKILNVGEENILQIQTSVMAENFYTQSKTAELETNYITKFSKKGDLADKKKHKNKKVIKGMEVLDLEDRVADLEGATADIIAKLKIK